MLALRWGRRLSGWGRSAHQSQNTFTTMAIAVKAITNEIQNSADGSHVALSGFLRTGFSFSNRDPRPRPGLPFEDAIHRLGLRQRGAFDRGYVLQMNPDVRDSERAAHVAVGGKVLCRGKRSHVTAITPRETNTVTYGIGLGRTRATDEPSALVPLRVSRHRRSASTVGSALCSFHQPSSSPASWSAL